MVCLFVTHLFSHGLVRFGNNDWFFHLCDGSHLFFFSRFLSLAFSLQKNTNKNRSVNYKINEQKGKLKATDTERRKDKETKHTDGPQQELIELQRQGC
jgi:hypothetical protein